VSVTKEITRLEKSNVKLSITVPKEDVRSQYQDMLKDYAKNIQLPGFRKGKVPQEVLERKFAEALKGEAMGRIIESVLQDYFKDETLPRNEKPLPYAMPALEEEPKFDLDSDLQFAVTYDVLPEVKIGQWKGLDVEYPYAEVGKEDIDRELDEIRERNSVVMDKDEGAAAASGDVVTVDYSILDDKGESIADLERKDFAFTIGGGTNFYKFDDDIIGMKKGETKEFEKKFQDDFFEASLAGQWKKMRVTLTSLKEKKLPDLDDDLAQDVDEKYKTLNDLKNSIKERLGKNLELKQRDMKVNELLKKIMENTPVTLPESMIKAEIESRFRRIARYYNTNPESMMQMMLTGEGSEERVKEWRETAEKALHSRLIIETLIEEQNIEVTDIDIEKEFERIAGENGAEVDEIKKNYNEEAMFYLKEEIKEKRLIDLLFAENTLKQGKKEKYLDFMSGND
jgi:trigger factor